jgi:hypothetical protein
VGEFGGRRESALWAEPLGCLYLQPSASARRDNRSACCVAITSRQVVGCQDLHNRPVVFTHELKHVGVSTWSGHQFDIPS